MRTFSAATSAPPHVVWPLIARPDAWARWSPHVRGAWGLGSPEVEPGAIGAVRLLGVLPLPAQVTAKRAGRSWSWRVGPVELAHRVEPRSGGGSTIGLELSAPGPLEAALALAYGPLVEVALRRLATEAERVEGTPAD